MDTGICIWSSVALRAEASHRSEMVSQLLFGETYTILEMVTDWYKIRTTDCAYEGWLYAKQHYPLTAEEYALNISAPQYFVRDTFLYVQDTLNHIAAPLFIGSRFPMPKDGIFSLGNRAYKVCLPQPTALPHHEGLSEQQDLLLDFAFHYLNAPYLWGGRTPAGIDCSGFVQNVYNSIGIRLPRDAAQQVEFGDIVDFVDEARIGDLAFFENEEGYIIHVGIVCGYHQILHASGHVQINTLDSNGIFRADMNKYTHRLRIIKRILE
ncbi:MAG: C40 family peptidase [Bacteroidales bacterium]|nr:C40 family peptidase [Bacteroidales bacterium]MBR3572114.1 C40 family peptidase [Bacteroidales bacterium]